MPITPTSTTEQLRDRAAALRRAATLLQQSGACELHRRAGPETWLGPTPARCLDSLSSMRTAVLNAIDELRDVARRLERRADQLEVVHQ